MSENQLPFHSNGWNGYVAGSKWKELFLDLDKWLADNPGELIVRYPCRDVRKVTTPLGVVYVKDIRALTDAGYYHRDLFSLAKWIFRRSRAVETWNASKTLIRKGFLCPVPLLAVRRRKRITPRDVFISAEVPLPNLFDHLPKGMNGTILAEMLADEIRRLHRSGFAHGDCILRNVCYDEKNRRIAYLDNDRTWLPPAFLRRHYQCRNLAQMAYSLLKRFGEASCKHFLEFYSKRAGWPSAAAIKSMHATALKRRNKKKK